MGLTSTFKTNLLGLLFSNSGISNIGDATGLVGSSVDGNYYIALTTTTPTEVVAGTECSYTGYTRVAVSRNNGFTEVGSNASNTSPVTFPEATAGSETATYFEIYTAATGGDRIGFGQITSPAGGLIINPGTIPEFPIGDLDIDIT